MSEPCLQLLVGQDMDRILLKIAIDAANQGRRVWFLSLQPLEVVPKEIVPPCKDVLQLITFIYLRSFKELVKQLNGCHTWRLPPDLLVVKGLDEYCQDYEPTKGLMQASTISALLQNCLQVSGTSIVTTSSVGVPQSLRDFYFDRVKIVDEQVQKDEEIILGIQN